MAGLLDHVMYMPWYCVMVQVLMVRAMVFVLTAGLMAHNHLCETGFSGEACGVCPNSWPDDAQ